METEFNEDLFSDILGRIYRRVKNKVEEELRQGPYAIIRIRWLKKELRGQRGMQFIVKKLSQEYNVKRMGSWLIITPRDEDK